MTAGLKPYPAYKDAGVPWLGKVPEHWGVLPGRACYREKKTPNTGLKESAVLSLSYGQIVVKPSEKLHGLVPASFETYQIVDPGDIICRPTDLQNDWNSLRFGSSRNRGIITSAYMCFHAKNGMTQEYGHLLLHTYDLKKIFYGLGSGLRQNLDWQDFKYLPCLVPSTSEQAAIVRFLDHADRRIRRYIRAKQKLTKLLEEQKQAIIHRAVTRGLDPNVCLKPSGVEWLGDVPGHWTLKRFKFLARVTSGQVDPRESEHRRKILVAPNHIRSGTGEIAYQETAEEQGADSGKYEVRQGQIIYSKIRPNLRKAAIASVDCLCSADMYPIAAREAELRPPYLLLLMLSAPFTKYAVDCSLRVAMPKVNREALGQCWLWYPSLEEQRDILRFVERASGPSDLAISRAEREIALLREYRTRLIADVVTGKLDVREAAARLPEEAEEPEPPDEAETLADSDDEGEGVDVDVAPEEAEV
jgi:type I restriction enzyme S subunit